MSECTGTAPVTPEPDKDAETDVTAPKPEKKSNVGMILVIFALAGAAGAAYYYIKFVKGRKPKDEDLDAITCTGTPNDFIKLLISMLI